MRKVDFLMTRVYVVFPFCFGKTNIFRSTRKAQKTTTGLDKSVNFNKSYKLHFDEKSKIRGQTL